MPIDNLKGTFVLTNIPLCYYCASISVYSYPTDFIKSKINYAGQ